MRRGFLTRSVIAAAGALALLPAGPARGDDVSDPADRQVLAKFAGHAERVPDRMSVDACRRMAAEEPEGYTWKILPQVDMLLTAYERTGEGKYLDLFVRTVANLRAAMTRGPDGYLGWCGKPLGLFRNPAKPDLRADVILSSFQMVKMLCRFLEIVDKDKALAAGATAKRGGGDWLGLLGRW